MILRVPLLVKVERIGVARKICEPFIHAYLPWKFKEKMLTVFQESVGSRVCWESATGGTEVLL